MTTCQSLHCQARLARTMVGFDWGKWGKRGFFLGNDGIAERKCRLLDLFSNRKICTLKIDGVFHLGAYFFKSTFFYLPESLFSSQKSIPKTRKSTLSHSRILFSCLGVGVRSSGDTIRKKNNTRSFFCRSTRQSNSPTKANVGSKSASWATR